MNMTSSQSWAIFCLSKIDVRNTEIDIKAAGNLIEALKTGGDSFDAAIKLLKETPGAIIKGEAKPKQDWRKLYTEAHDAGMIAGAKALPTPMTVQQHASPFNDNSPVVKEWHVPEGACGFAWVTIRPGTCSFAKWLKKNDLASVAYGGGMQVWVHQFNQSVERKEAYAHAFAEVLRLHGIKAYAGSRLD